MTAYTKGTQVGRVGFDKNAFREKQESMMSENMRKMGFTEKSTTPQGQTMYSLPQNNSATTGQVEGSFGRMIGGMPSMGELEAASMRLADAAAKREIITEALRYNRERAGKLADESRSNLYQRISKYKSDLSAVQNMPIKTYGDQLLKTKKTAELKSEIQKAESDLRNLNTKEQFEARNIS